MGEKKAFIVGCGKYESSGLDDLESPKLDVAAIRDVLCKRKAIGSSDEGSIEDSRFELFGGDYLLDLPATQVYENVDAFCESLSKDDTVFFYFSGHGLVDDGKFYLAAHGTEYVDGRVKNPAKAIEFAYITKSIKDARVRRVIFCLDCCYSAHAYSALLQSKDAGADYLEDVSKAVMSEGQGFEAIAKGKEKEEGVFLLAASSEFEKSYSPKDAGMSFFTQEVVNGLTGAVTNGVSKHDGLAKVTVFSLFKYVAKQILEQGVPQTPRIFAHRLSSCDFPIITFKTLDGEYDVADFPVWDQSNLSLFENLTPTYILDRGFRFVTWNAAFEMLVARELGLQRGHHVESFIGKLRNWDTEVKLRSLAAFPDTRTYEEHRPTHSERLVVETKSFGLVEFQKLASKLEDLSGWCVQLNLNYAENEKIWDDVECAMQTHSRWTRYAECYDTIIDCYSKKRELVTNIVHQLGDAKECLDIGAGTGSATLELLSRKDVPDRRVHAIDTNYTMLKRLQRNAEKAGVLEHVKISHSDALAALGKLGDDIFDGCVMVNVLFALDNPKEVLDEVYRVLKPGAVLALCTSHENTDVNVLFSQIELKLISEDLWDERQEDFALAKQCNLDMVPIIRRYSREQMLGYIEAAGFSFDRTVDYDPVAYDGCVFVLSARKESVVLDDQRVDSLQANVVSPKKL